MNLWSVLHITRNNAWERAPSTVPMSQEKGKKRKRRHNPLGTGSYRPGYLKHGWGTVTAKLGSLVLFALGHLSQILKV